MPELIHIIYASVETQAFARADLLHLLEKARIRNTQLNLTGILLYAENNFFQVLEGEAEVVDKLFKEILQDKRHGKIVTIIREPIAKRSFGEWSMGYTAVTSKDLQEITGLNDFFSDGSFFTSLEVGRAKKLLNAFKEGRWRSKLKTTPVEMAER